MIRFLISILSIIISLAHAEISRPFKVKINITSNEDKEKLYSYLSRELRSLGDVEVVNEFENNKGDVLLEIKIFCLKNESASGATFGYSLSYLFERRISKVSWWPFFDKWMNSNAAKIAKSGLENAVWVDDYGLSVTPPEGLKSACESIVATFDSSTLKNLRETLESLKKNHPK